MRSFKIVAMAMLFMLCSWSVSLAYATPTPTPVRSTTTATITPPAAVTSAIVLTDANLREGPGTNYKRVGSVRAKATIKVVGTNPKGGWYQLDTGQWIAASLIQLIVSSSATPTTPNSPITSTVLAATPTSISTPTPAIAGTLPYTFTGTGDSIVDVSAYGDKFLLLLIYGNASSRHFSVQSYDADDNPLELIVNTTDYYVGELPLNLTKAPAAFLEIKAVGEWSIIVFDLAAASRIQKGVPFTGKGDNVLITEDSAIRLAEIIGNPDARYFGIQGYSDSGYSQLIVNTTDPYVGTVRLQKGTILFVIRATGEWSITTK